ncbi:MAG TPA: hypothetical protein VKV74_14020 [Bryobacteraceae bacterium]|nr:hypothetical protein [Bryobacteraceae bacterium]
MKLRLYNDSLRLRLSQSEVAQFEREGRVDSIIDFPPDGALSYSIEATDVGRLTARLSGGRVSVLVPKAMAQTWISTDQIAMEDSRSTPRILIEKDFQCLHRSTEEDADSFPNPLAARG